MNYKELCETLNLPEKQHGERTAQLNQLMAAGRVTKTQRGQYEISIEPSAPTYRYSELRKLIVDDLAKEPLPEVLMFKENGEPFYGIEELSVEECKRSRQPHQLQQWQRYYDFELVPDTRKYIFRGRREVPLPQIDLGRKSVYKTYLEQQVMYLCYKNGSYNMNGDLTFITSKSALYCTVGFFTKRFLDVLYSKQPSRPVMDYNTIYRQFKDIVFEKCHSIVWSFRNSLKSQALMESRDVIQILECAINEDGTRDYEHPKGGWVTLSSHDAAKITIHAKRDVMDAMNQKLKQEAEDKQRQYTPVKTEQDIFLRGLSEDYYKGITDYIRNEYGWYAYREAIEFIARPDILNRELDSAIKLNKLESWNALYTRNTHGVNDEFSQFMNTTISKTCNQLQNFIDRYNNDDGAAIFSPDIHNTLYRKIMYNLTRTYTDQGTPFYFAASEQTVEDYRMIITSMVNRWIKFRAIVPGKKLKMKQKKLK